MSSTKGIRKAQPLSFPVFSQYKNKRVHIGVCGSISAYKILDLMRRFQDCGLIVSITLTPSAQEFITPLSFESLGASVVYTQMFPQNGVNLANIGSVFPHLEPGQIADAMLIAPASASTLSRLATGAADELLACQVLAFDGPILLAPAMNTKMWKNPATEANIETLLERGYFLTEPESGLLACKEIGTGRLADLKQIYLETLKLLTEQDLFGKKVLITLGPTQEKWDTVRVWTNNSTGTMGMSFALAAWLRGATVYIIAGSVDHFIPHDPHFHYHYVESATEMFDACDNIWEQMDIGIFTAAVADFRPSQEMPSPLVSQKIKDEIPFEKDEHSSDKKSFFFKHEDKNAHTQDTSKSFHKKNTEEKHIKETHTEEDDAEKNLHFPSDKFKKEHYQDGFSLAFLPNKDILKSMGARKQAHQKIIGFAAESGTNMTELGLTVQKKLFAKNCDILVGNFLDEAMGADNNRVLIGYQSGKMEQIQSMPKTSLAFETLTKLMQLSSQKHTQSPVIPQTYTEQYTHILEKNMDDTSTYDEDEKYGTHHEDQYKNKQANTNVKSDE